MSGQITYPWQQSVLEAFLASRDSLPLKMSIAQKTIAARLRDRQQQPDLSEQTALDDALRALQVLTAEIDPQRAAELEKQSEGKEIA